MSDIRVSVQWKDPTVFAGEDIECTITFKNIALARRIHHSASPSPHTTSHGSHRERWKETLPIGSANAPASAKHRKSPSFSGFSQSHARTHRQALSNSSVNGFAKSSGGEVHDSISGPANTGNNKHRRSVSIVSIRGEANEDASRHGQLLSFGLSGHSHTRAASLHVTPRRNGPLSNGSSPGIPYPTYFTTC